GAQVLVRADRSERVVELATGAGVHAIVPGRTARCVARWDDGPRGQKALARWRSTVREAAKQARRPWQPVVEEPVTTAALARRAAAVDLAAVLHESATERIADPPLPASGGLLPGAGPEGVLR